MTRAGIDPTGVSIRRATEVESDEVASVWWRAREASTPLIPPPVHGEDDVRGWFRDVVLADREVWVGDLAGVVVAVLVLDEDWVDQLYVEPTLTGWGIGSLLLGHAKAQRPNGLQLWTFQDNTGARRFYERHGFAAIERTAGDNEEGAPDIRYRWPGDTTG